MIIRSILLLSVVFCSLLFSSCGSSNVTTKKDQTRSKYIVTDNLSAEERDKYDYYFLEALRLKHKGDYDGAFEMLTHCIDINPKGSSAIYELSRFYLAINQPEKSEEMLKKAVELAQDNYWYKQTLASYYQQKGALPQAINIFEDMSTQFPQKLDPLMSLVVLYNNTKQYEEVIKTLDKIEELDGASEQLSMEKFKMYLNLNNTEKAFSEIENLAKEHPYDMRYLTILGDVYLENGKEEEAYKTYMKVLESEPQYAPAMLSLASYYKKMGKDSLCQSQLDSVLLNDKVDSDTKMDVMRQIILQSEQGDKDSTKVASLFNSILNTKQDNADLSMLAAQYFVTKKMEQQAISALNKVIELDLENTPARLQLLSYALRKQDADEVIKICQPGIDYTPEVVELYYYLGLSYYQKEMEDKALEVYIKGVNQITEKSDKNIVSDLYAIMGDLYHQKKMSKEAYAAYDSSLVYKSDNINALNNYAYYLSVEKRDLDKAEEMSYKTVKADPSNSTYLDTYAWILFEKNKYSQAKIYIDQAIKNEEDKSSVLTEHAGDIYYMCGEKSKALEFWKEALELSNKDEDNESGRTKKEIDLLKKKISTKKYFEK